jgi:hypothetical protein
MDLGKSLVALTLVLGLATPAAAQTTYYTPNGVGGFTVTTPFAPLPLNPSAPAPSLYPTYINPTGNGGFSVTTPFAPLPLPSSPPMQPLVRPYGR